MRANLICIWIAYAAFVIANGYAASLLSRWVGALPLWRECHGAVAPVCMAGQLLGMVSIVLALGVWVLALFWLASKIN